MSLSQFRPGTRLHFHLKVVLAIYVAAVALLPLTHHDVACHFKSSTHCTTCVLAGSGEAAADFGALTRAPLVDAGRPAAAPSSRIDFVSHGPTTGRSPPSRG